MILIEPRICVIAMVAVVMIDVRRILVVVVRGGSVLVVVIAMLHIPVVPVRRVLIRGIQVARPRAVGMIGVGRCVGVVRVQRTIDVIVMSGVGVIVEHGIPMHVAVIAMIAVPVAMTVDMRCGIRVVAMRRPV